MAGVLWSVLLLACGGETTPATPAAATPAAGPAVVRLLAVLDGNGDGVLGPDELAKRAHPGLAWKTYDADGSGSIDAGELAVILREVTPLSDDHRGPPPPGTVAPGGPGGPRPPGPPPGQPPPPPAPR
jgi:hypothetical protein